MERGAGINKHCCYECLHSSPETLCFTILGLGVGSAEALENTCFRAVGGDGTGRVDHVGVALEHMDFAGFADELAERRLNPSRWIGPNWASDLPRGQSMSFPARQSAQSGRTAALESRYAPKPYHDHLD